MLTYKNAASPERTPLTQIIDGGPSGPPFLVWSDVRSGSNPEIRACVGNVGCWRWSGRNSLESRHRIQCCLISPHRVNRRWTVWGILSVDRKGLGKNCRAARYDTSPSLRGKGAIRPDSGDRDPDAEPLSRNSHDATASNRVVMRSSGCYSGADTRSPGDRWSTVSPVSVKVRVTWSVV